MFTSIPKTFNLVSIDKQVSFQPHFFIGSYKFLLNFIIIIPSSTCINRSGNKCHQLHEAHNWWEKKGTDHPVTSISFKLTVFSVLALLTFSIQDPVYAALSSRGH